MLGRRSIGTKRPQNGQNYSKMAGDINEIPKILSQSVQGCGTGFHELDPQSATFSLAEDGKTMIVKMRCSFCNNTIVREEPAGALIPGLNVEQKQPQNAPAAQEEQPPHATEPQQPRVVIVQEAFGAMQKESDEFWGKLK